MDKKTLQAQVWNPATVDRLARELARLAADELMRSGGAVRRANYGRRIKAVLRRRVSAANIVAVVREIVGVAECPVRELVEHHTCGAVTAGERDRRVTRILPVEGLARAVAGSEPRDAGEPVLGEPGGPPE